MPSFPTDHNRDDDDRVDGRELRPLWEPGSDDLLDRDVKRRLGDAHPENTGVAHES